jgi:hypothetical protein
VILNNFDHKRSDKAYYKYSHYYYGESKSNWKINSIFINNFEGGVKLLTSPFCFLNLFELMIIPRLLIHDY